MVAVSDKLENVDIQWRVDVCFITDLGGCRALLMLS